ncbi:MAG: NUDIX hydrolase [Verrucomicrobia bacterium]|jgi:8-oxo-dGTP pyrophosphatase MutT (NUDIX family)|nr:NUDIX hydrolase [Verrucomicrobiota bacterium]
MIQRWPLVRSELRGDYHVFRLRRDFKTSPRTGREMEFHVLECPDWVNVIALTPDRQIVLVEQYRHGTDSVDLEIPGGVMDGADASPVETGIRELREETGFEGENARLIGRVAPNPAILNNACHTVLVENCVRRHALDLDSGEDLATHVMPLSALPELMATGRFHHSLMIAALYQFHLWENGWRLRI